MSSEVTAPANVAAAAAATAKPLRAGVIGGMGPDATVEFYQRVVNKTRSIAGAKTDQDHIIATIDMSPDVVNRQDAILRGVGLERCREQLRQSGERIVASGCDFAVCVCNTAHFFHADMQEGLGGVPLLSIIGLTADRILRHVRERRPPTESAIASSSSPSSPPKAAILAASGCVQGGLFQEALRRRGIEYLVPSTHIQEMCMRAIYLVKAGDIAAGKAVFDEVLDFVVVDNAVDMVILGCTELPLLVDTTTTATATTTTTTTTTTDGAAEADAEAEAAGFGAWKKRRADGGVVFFDTVDILADTVVRVSKGIVPLDEVVESLRNPRRFGK